MTATASRVKSDSFSTRVKPFVSHSQRAHPGWVSLRSPPSFRLDSAVCPFSSPQLCEDSPFAFPPSFCLMKAYL